MTAAEPPPWRISTTTNPILPLLTTTDTLPEDRFSLKQTFPSVYEIISQLNADSIVTNKRPSKCKDNHLPHLPPITNLPRFRISIDFNEVSIVTDKRSSKHKDNHIPCLPPITNLPRCSSISIYLNEVSIMTDKHPSNRTDHHLPRLPPITNFPR